MNYLIDTQILILYIGGDKRLDKKIVSIIDNPDNEIYLSSASLWEMAIKISLGKLKIDIPFNEMEFFLKEMDFILLDLDFIHFNVLLDLPFHHSDPFDRLIIAQALAENLPIISLDRKFSLYSAPVIK